MKKANPCFCASGAAKAQELTIKAVSVLDNTAIFFWTHTQSQSFQNYYFNYVINTFGPI